MKSIPVLSEYIKGLINDYKDHGNDYSMNDVIRELEVIKEKVTELEEEK